MHFAITSLDDLEQVAASILTFGGEERVYLFYGEMGVGKTTLINKLCHTLGIKGHPSSPTFSIVNEYEIGSGIAYHFDFYRLKNQSEALDMGYEDYFFSGDYCFVEWPEKIADLLPPSYVKIELSLNDDGARSLTVTKI